MTTIKELKMRKKQWMQDTLSEAQLKKELKLKPTEIQGIKAETEYGKTRYSKAKVLKFLKSRDDNQVCF